LPFSGADFRAVDKFGNTSDFFAVGASRECVELAGRLLQARADPTKRHAYGVPPMSLAEECGIAVIVERFANRKRWLTIGSACMHDSEQESEIAR
jgi:hypothetical protein